MSNQIYTGDCFEQLPALDANSVHAIVTDPPYGLAFMGRSWDDFEPTEYQAWCERWASECLRVLKPGGHLLAFSGNRTHHRLMTGIEDAGYEIRDTITWHYGSGFPKALDVSKAIDKQADAEREVVGKKKAPDGKPLEERVSHSGEEYDERSTDYDDCKRDTYIRKPATEQAKQWDGFKSALKPATEFVCVARSPLTEDTIAENVVAHGTGALNIDATRIGMSEADKQTLQNKSSKNAQDHESNKYGDYDKGIATEPNEGGRYPSNVVFDEKQADILDAEVGELDAGASPAGSHAAADNSVYGEYDEQENKRRRETDSGGPSRYFYTSKASKAERTLDGKIDNAHPTVKPIDLMEWLVSLATAKGQTVLDPFAGSGTTCKAAKHKSRQFIGIEEQPKWADVARVRSGLPPVDHSHIRSDDAQHGLEQF